MNLPCLAIQGCRMGMTLLEIMISLLVLSVLTVAIVEAQASSVRYAAHGQAQDTLAEESGRVLDLIQEDLASSAWYFPAGSSISYQVSSTADRSLRYLPYALIQDTTGTADTQDGLADMFTYAERPATNKLSFPVPPIWLDSALSGVPADGTTRIAAAATPTAAEAERWQTSYFARSQELIFLRASVSAWNHTIDRPMAKSEDTPPSMYFTGKRNEWAAPAANETDEESKRKRLRILHASGWKPVRDSVTNEVTGYTERKVYKYSSANPDGVEITEGTTAVIPYGVVMEAGLIDFDQSLAEVGVNWTTIDGDAYTVASQSEDNLSEFTFAVVHSPVGLGRLVRARRVPVATAPATEGVEAGQRLPGPATATFRMVVDRVLSDNVVRVVFDTYRTVDKGAGSVTSLDINQLRVRVYFVIDSKNGAPPVYSIAERVVTMRARNSAFDKNVQEAESSAGILGTTPVGITY